jgi:hypothetical protein
MYACKHVYLQTGLQVNMQASKQVSQQAGKHVCRFASKQVDLQLLAMVYSITIWFYTIRLKIQTVGQLSSLVRPTTRRCGYRATASRSGEHERPIPSLDVPLFLFFDRRSGSKRTGERATYNTLKRAEGAIGERLNCGKHAICLSVRHYPLCYACKLAYRKTPIMLS